MTPSTPPEDPSRYDTLPPSEAVARLWAATSQSGQDQIREIDPALADALDRLVEVIQHARIEEDAEVWVERQMRELAEARQEVPPGHRWPRWLRRRPRLPRPVPWQEGPDR